MTTIVRITDATAVVRAATRRETPACLAATIRRAARAGLGCLGAGAGIRRPTRRRTRRARRVDQGRIHGRAEAA